jgi:hypothetical protein
MLVGVIQPLSVELNQPVSTARTQAIADRVEV